MNIMIIILGILAYFIIGGIILGIVVNIMNRINNDLKDYPDYNIDLDDICFIVMLWPITVPLLIGIGIIAIVAVLISILINIIVGFFTKNKKR